jgi:hypothetical protein
MQKLFFAAAFLWASAMFGASCVTATLLSYVSLGATGCQDGATTFSGFTSESGQTIGSPIALDQITVTPGGTASVPTLQFSGTLTAANSSVLESFFRFSVTGGSFTAATMSLTGGFTAGGTVTATEDICPGGSFAANMPTGCTKGPKSLVTLTEVGFSMLSDSTTFAASTPLDVFVDITADGTGGSASFGTATVAFTRAAAVTTPEPATFGLFLSICTACFVGPRVSKKLAQVRRNHASL